MGSSQLDRSREHLRITPSKGRAMRHHNHSRRSDPQATIIGRTQLAINCRDGVYSCRARPLSRALRKQWVALVTFYVKSRMLQYGEVLSVAKNLGAELRIEGGGAPPVTDGPRDYMLRRELSRRLVATARRIEAKEGPRDEFLHRAQQRVLRSIAMMIDAERKKAARAARVAAERSGRETGGQCKM